jgi:mannose-6-phosphate isomerase
MPLRFREIPKRKVWARAGGLRAVAGKDFPAGEKIGESWEIADYGRDVSVVAAGPLAGKTLRDLVRQQGVPLMGRALHQKHPRQFPLLLKLIDAGARLSVQVHPSDEAMRRLGRREPGKVEAWYVLHAEPGAVMYHGLLDGVTRDDFKQRLKEGAVERALRRFLVQAGDVIFCPPGTVHAVGAGLVLVEIQQASDTTLRLFDWHRPQSPESPRPLHIRESLEVIQFGRQPPEKIRPQPVAGWEWRREKLIACDKFEMELWGFTRPAAMTRHAAGGTSEGPGAGFEILTCVGGRGTVSAGGLALSLKRGDSVLVPAEADSWAASPEPELALLHITARG